MSKSLWTDEAQFHERARQLAAFAARVETAESIADKLAAIRGFLDRWELLGDLRTTERVRRWLVEHDQQLAAALLDHYLAARGGIVALPATRLRESAAVRDAEARLLGRAGLAVLRQRWTMWIEPRQRFTGLRGFLRAEAAAEIRRACGTRGQVNLTLDTADLFDWVEGA